MTKTLYSVICQFTGELIDQHDDRRDAIKACDDYNDLAGYDQYVVVKSTNGRQS
ncbi:hypothetical protein UFOVP838_26 [uncultured Caudovirales phage]|uniref:Uncharacterized protein n=1 Tax=uncultured Caudovirales phage TaxID=2100421 RepID=A0A6J5Q550_9CAUD|nr:hypothetical protein UFOVP838_26 [uncultured Caudovirales phage]CAB4171948.1 hypothetical protein UFOVP932_41 [uncultured Caudovirales phage]CAB4177677.1 hypothetical protein UFOVP1010_29 [uncultured Caudovirales phage]CAB4201889.1 hypothetical protein UFOVP1359_17 [uncultured Caudovirales phage]